jgi:hypothetical protein
MSRFKRAGRLLAWCFVGVAFLGMMGGWELVFILSFGVLVVEYLLP